MIERKTIRFSKWKPVARDNRVSYSYINPRDGRLVRLGSDRWMRAKSRIASSAIATGADSFEVRGGIGTREWSRTVLVSQEDADAFFTEAIDRGWFMLRGMYRRAVLARERRLAR